VSGCLVPEPASQLRGLQRQGTPFQNYPDEYNDSGTTDRAPSLSCPGTGLPASGTGTARAILAKNVLDHVVAKVINSDLLASANTDSVFEEFFAPNCPSLTATRHDGVAAELDSDTKLSAQQADAYDSLIALGLKEAGACATQVRSGSPSS